MTTDDEATLLKAVIENPDDDAPRLAYADWCDKRGDPRGRFIRVQVELAKVEFDLENPKRSPLRNESKKLLSEHGHEWIPKNNPLMSDCAVHRGFIAGATVTAEVFLTQFPELSSSFPIQFVTVKNLAARAREVLTSSNLRKLTALSANNSTITDDDLMAFARCPSTQNIWWLDLGDNQITEKGVEALITSPYLKKLGFVWLRGNPCDPIEVVGFDQGCLVYSHMPEIARKFEDRFGPIRWFSYRENAYPFDPVEKR